MGKIQSGHVLITGASRGIGRCVAEIFAARGFRVSINYLNSGELAKETAHRAEKLGASGVQIYRADVSDSAQVRQMVEECESAFGGIDVLVCNAGIAQSHLFTDVGDEQWRKIFAVNTDGPFYCCREVLPGMIRRKSGSIVLVSSIWGISGASCEVPYSASKAAIIGMTKAMAREVAPSGIRVNCVAPGVIDTEMNAGLDSDTVSTLCGEIPMGRLGTAEEAAQAIAFLASPEASYITGQILTADGGYLP